VCADCGEKISTERIRVNPTSQFCVDCQTMFEKRGKFERHRMGHIVHSNGEEVESIESYLVRGST